MLRAVNSLSSLERARIIMFTYLVLIAVLLLSLIASKHMSH